MPEKRKPIKWPATEEQLKAAGYSPGESRKCGGKRCTATIEWWTTPKDKRIPLHRLEDGTLQPHWADCIDAGTFRR